MLPANVFSGAAFRSAVLFLVLFMLVAGLTGMVVLHTTRWALTAELRSQVSSEISMLEDTYTDEGKPGLLDFVNTATISTSPRFYVMAVFSMDGKRVAGDAIDMPPLDSWTVTQPRTAARDSSSDFLSYARQIGDNVVVFGRPLHFLEATTDTLWRALTLAIAAVTLGALAIGYTLSLGVSAKLRAMTAILDDVSRGNTLARLPVDNRNDQIDQVSRQMNTHLERLTELMATTRNTVIAVAHDLKSPLNRAYMLLQQATEEDDLDKRNDMLLRCQDELRRLNAIFETIMRISRIESSHDRTGYASFSASELVSEIIQIYEPVIEAQKKTLTLNTSECAGMQIFGDRRMIGQLMVNLVENALRHGGSTIEISAFEDAGETVLRVADDGSGIPEESYDDVLRPFFRLNEERKAPGSGLGLSLVKAIATRHGASVTLSDNKPGLRVEVRFPRTRTGMR